MIDLIREVASNYNQKELTDLFGCSINDELLECILWSETSFPFNFTGSKDPLVIKEYYKNQLIDFFNSKTLPGQREDEIIENLRLLGEWP